MDKEIGNGRVCRVCGKCLVGRQIKYCTDCNKGMFRTPPKPDALGRRVQSGAGPLAGMSIGEISYLAWNTYRMSYGRLVGYVKEMGRLPPKPKASGNEKRSK